ncbi:putative gustatory receptor 39b [Drosophila takahashii]|uniref:putative gustatory receptor 39b n=1 Tax=Drosophila takahashii TaxID=29030 RepID=UPI001CF9106B|nr:putative gustatory receptor 39b [Drosophila takahashii]
MLYSLQTYLKYFALLGLVPWSECAHHQFIQKVYSVLLIVFNVATFGISIYYPQTSELFISLMVNVIVFVAKIVCSTVIVLQMMVHYEDYYRFCMEIKCLRLRLQGELKMHLGGLGWQTYAKILGLGFGFLLSLLPSIYVALSGSLLYFWASLLSILIIRMHCVLMLLYVDLLGLHVNLLGGRLQNVLDCHLLGANCVLDGAGHHLCSLEFLLALKQSHMELYHLFTHFNDLFGWSILSTYVVLFTDSTVNIYWTQQVLAEVYEYRYLYATFSVFVPSIIIIFVFCRCGEFCKRQNLLIGSHLRSLSCLPSPAREPAYNELLLEFIMQVEHNVLAINAEGFMETDNSLLMSILAAKVTYLIVLMQFSSL